MTPSNTLLRDALETKLHLGVSELRRSPSPYATSSQLEDVHVSLCDGSQLQALLKHVRSRGVKPAFVLDPMREIRTYQEILADRVDTAVCHASGNDWLLLEKVPGVELYQIGEIEVWQAVARWLAAFHDWGTRLSEATLKEAHLVEHTRHFYEVWMDRAVAHAPNSSQLQDLAHRHDRVIDQLLALRRTFIHGEFYPSNILVDIRNQLRVCPIDWEMAGCGPGLMDLAALTAGSWTIYERDSIASSYRDVLGPDVMSDDEFSIALNACRFQLAIQWLGWSAGWQPPREHATDWFAEALAAAERLGL